MCACCLKRSEEGIGFRGIGVTDNCGLPYRFWEPNSAPLKEQQMLLNTVPSLLNFFRDKVLLEWEERVVEARNVLFLDTCIYEGTKKN